MNETRKEKEKEKSINDTPLNWIVEINERNGKMKKNQEWKLIANENNDGKRKIKEQNNNRT